MPFPQICGRFVICISWSNSLLCMITSNRQTAHCDDDESPRWWLQWININCDQAWLIVQSWITTYINCIFLYPTMHFKWINLFIVCLVEISINYLNIKIACFVDVFRYVFLKISISKAQISFSFKLVKLTWLNIGLGWRPAAIFGLDILGIHSHTSTPHNNGEENVWFALQVTINWRLGCWKDVYSL